MFSMVTVASSTRMPTARAEAAQGHDVDGLAQEAQYHHRGQDGKRNGHGDDERAPPAPEEEQDHQGGEAGRDDRLVDHARDRPANEDGLVGEEIDLELRGQRARHPGTACRMLLTTSRVEASPILSTVSSVPRRPSRRTMFVCTLKPSRTLATSRT